MSEAPTIVEHALLVALTGRRHGLHASLNRMTTWARPTAISPPGISRWEESTRA